MNKKTTLCIFAIFFSAIAFAGKGKVVFSNKPIDEATGESLPPATFNVGDEIHCGIYMPKKTSAYKIKFAGNANRLNITAKIDGYDDSYHITDLEIMTPEELEKTFFSIPFNKDRSTGKPYSDELVEKINSLPLGTYVIKIEVCAYAYGGTEFPLAAKGEFTLKKTSNSKLKLGLTFNDVEAGMKDPKLEAKAVAATTAWLKQNGGGLLQKQECKILRNDWIIVTHPNTGAILARANYFAYLIKQGDKCKIRIYCLQQAYNGSGYQETLQHRDHLGTDTPYEHNLALNPECSCD